MSSERDPSAPNGSHPQRTWTPMRDDTQEAAPCSIYCQHNAEQVCECQPCRWIRENTAGFVHETRCPHA